jgi:cytochrome b561
MRLLQVALYVQVLLGLARFFGPFVGLPLDQRIWELHMGLGVAIALLALVRLGTSPIDPKPGLRAAARYMPLVPLALGLINRFVMPGNVVLIVTHMLFGLATIGLVEMAAARERRARA